MQPTVLITGAAQRVGAAIAHHLAGEGWNVVIHYRSSQSHAEVLANELSAKYPHQRFVTVASDLAQQGAAPALFKNPLLRDMEITALVNNASIFNACTLENTTHDFLRREMAVNFEAPLFLMQAFKMHSRRGSIVNMLDTNIVRSVDSHAAYLLAKKSLAEATRMAALAWAPAIRVNAVAPGPVLPPPGKDDDHLKQVVDKTPLKQQVSTADIAASVSFLLNNSSITGQVVLCDSGAHLI